MGDAATATAATGQQRLTDWTVATTNVVCFVLALLIPAYASGGLSDVLPNLGTAAGLAVFAYLWLLVWATTRWLLGHVDPSDDSLVRILLWAGASGALDGIVFLVGIVLVAGVPAALITSLELLSVALIALIGTPIAAVVGTVVGIATAGLDLLLLRTANAVGPATDRRPDRP